METNNEIIEGALVSESLDETTKKKARRVIEEILLRVEKELSGSDEPEKISPIKEPKAITILPPEGLGSQKKGEVTRALAERVLGKVYRALSEKFVSVSLSESRRKAADNNGPKMLGVSIRRDFKNPKSIPQPKPPVKAKRKPKALKKFLDRVTSNDEEAQASIENSIIGSIKPGLTRDEFKKILIETFSNLYTALQDLDNIEIRIMKNKLYRITIKTPEGVNFSTERTLSRILKKIFLSEGAIKNTSDKVEIRRKRRTYSYPEEILIVITIATEQPKNIHPNP